MEPRMIVDIIKFVVVIGGGLIAQGAYLKGQINATQKDMGTMKEDIKGLKGSVRYEDTCDAMHDGLDTRVKRLEGQANHG